MLTDEQRNGIRMLLAEFAEENSIFDEQVQVLFDQSNKPITDYPYYAILPDGTTVSGVTDAEGKTKRFVTDTPGKIVIHWGWKALELQEG